MKISKGQKPCWNLIKSEVVFMGTRETELLKQIKSWSLKDLAKSYKIRLQKSSDLEELFNYIITDLKHEREIDNEELYKRWHGYDKPKRQEHRYSFAKIRKILREAYNCELLNVTEYKGNRSTGHNTYQVVDLATNNILYSNCTLSTIGRCLEENGEL